MCLQQNSVGNVDHSLVVQGHQVQLHLPSCGPHGPDHLRVKVLYSLVEQDRWLRKWMRPAESWQDAMVLVKVENHCGEPVIITDVDVTLDYERPRLIISARAKSMNHG